MFLNRSDIPDDLQKLMDGFCAGTLLADEREQLESRLRDNEALQTYFLGYMAVHSGLYWSLRDQSPERPGQTPAPPVPQGLFPADSESSEHFLGPPQSFASTLGAAWHGWFSFGAMAVGAVVVLVGAVFFATKQASHSPDAGTSLAQSDENLEVLPGPRLAAQPGDAVGRVDKLESQVLIERDGAKRRAVVGMDILAADSLDVPAGSSAELTLVDQSHATLGPRTAIAFPSAREAVLREGYLQIDARDRLHGEPLAIATSNADTTIHGGRLAMGADQKRTQIRVSEGSVLASRRRDGQSVEIPEGYCSTIARAIDPLPRPSRGGTALCVVSGRGPHPEAIEWEHFDRILADRIISDRIWRSAMPVRVRTYDELRADDLKDCAIIVLSVFPFGIGAEQKLAELGVPQLPVPIICLEPAGFPVLGLTGPTEEKDFGFVKRGPVTMDITLPSHPLAAGFVGTRLDLFSHKRTGLGWGRPAASAITVAHLHKYPQNWTVFGYEPGTAMAQGVSPARRVGLVLTPIGADYDSPIFDLFEAAIDWCMESAPDQMVAYLGQASGMLRSTTEWRAEPDHL